MSLGYESIRSCMEFLRSCEGKTKVLLRAQAHAEPAENRKELVRSTDEEREEAIRLAKAGVPLVQICQKMNRQMNTIRRILGLAGVEMRHLVRPFANHELATEETGLAIKKLIESGKSPEMALKIMKKSHRVGFESLAMVGGAKTSHLKNGRPKKK